MGRTGGDIEGAVGEFSATLYVKRCPYDCQCAVDSFPLLIETIEN